MRYSSVKIDLATKWPAYLKIAFSYVKWIYVKIYYKSSITIKNH